MSLFGIDIGSKNIVVAALNKNNVYESVGCDVLANENSNRLTPAIMSLKGSKRYIGDSAYQMINNNFKNTISSVKHFLGDKLTDKEVENYSDYCISPNIKDGKAYYSLEFCGKQIEFEALQVLSQYFLKSKQIIDQNISPINDYRISVAIPPYYDFLQIESVFSAANIVGLNVIDLVFENTAVSTCYYIDNIKRMKLLTHPEYVMFVDMGHSAATVTITEYTNNNISVISAKSDISLGGILIDRFIVDYLSQIFSEKYSINPINNQKSMIKLFRASEQCKQSLNPENVNKVPVNIDCLYEDYDLSVIIERSIVENAININNFADRLKSIVLDVLNLGNLSIDQLKSVEIIGGTMRIPYLKNILRNILGNKLELSTTLNMDECISKGCVYYSLFRRFSREPISIRDYNNIDITSLKNIGNFNNLRQLQVQLDKQDEDNKLRSDLINQIEQLIINTHKRVDGIQPEKRQQLLTLISYCEEWLHSDECEKSTTQNLQAKYNSLSTDIQSYFQSGYLGGAVFIENCPSGPPFQSKSGTGPTVQVQNNNIDRNSQKHIYDPDRKNLKNQPDKNTSSGNSSVQYNNMAATSNNNHTNISNNKNDSKDNNGQIPAYIPQQSHRNGYISKSQSNSHNSIDSVSSQVFLDGKSDIPVRQNSFLLETPLTSSLVSSKFLAGVYDIDTKSRDSIISNNDNDQNLNEIRTIPSSPPRQLTENEFSNNNLYVKNQNSQPFNTFDYTCVPNTQYRIPRDKFFTGSLNIEKRYSPAINDIFDPIRGRSDLPQRKSRIHDDNPHLNKKVNIGNETRLNNESFSHMPSNSPILSPEPRSSKDMNNGPEIFHDNINNILNIEIPRHNLNSQNNTSLSLSTDDIEASLPPRKSNSTNFPLNQLSPERSDTQLLRNSPIFNQHLHQISPPLQQNYRNGDTNMMTRSFLSTQPTTISDFIHQSNGKLRNMGINNNIKTDQTSIDLLPNNSHGLNKRANYPSERNSHPIYHSHINIPSQNNSDQVDRFNPINQTNHISLSNPINQTYYNNKNQPRYNTNPY